MSIVYSVFAIVFVLLHIIWWLSVIVMGVFLAPAGILIRKIKLEVTYLFIIFSTLINWLSMRPCVFSSTERYFRDLAHPGTVNQGFVENGLRMLHIDPNGAALFTVNSIFISVGLLATIFWHVRASAIRTNR